MLRLRPHDNQKQCFWLGPQLIRVGRYADALFLCQSWLRVCSPDSDGLPPKGGGSIFAAPDAALLSDEREEWLSKNASCDTVHTAALAAFQLRGRCPQATQYLRIAVRTNPGILIKVIGRRTRPGRIIPL
jgi:hypothetical protein